LEGFECDLNTYHSHGKEGANKRHHQACGAEKDKPYVLTTKQMWNFYLKIIAEEMMNFPYSPLSQTNRMRIKELTMLFITQYCANLGNLIDYYEFTSY
jgi:hypothetical protein